MNFELEKTGNEIEVVSNLPYSREEIEGREEMRKHEARELGLSEDASFDEIAEKKDAVSFAKIAVALGLPEDTSYEEVIEGEKKTGDIHFGYRVMLGLGKDSTDEDIIEARRRADEQEEEKIRIVAEEMRFNRAKNISPLERSEAK